MSATDIVSFVSKTVTTYDGSPENLLSFIDALELISDTVPEANHPIAVRVIKTKLTGSARSYISNEATIEEIITLLKENIKQESSALAINSMQNLKKNNPLDYAAEMRKLCTALKSSFIAEGVPPSMAETYTAAQAAAAISKQSHDMRLIMTANNFTSTSEVLNKFAQQSAIEQPLQRINKFHKFNNNKKYNNNNNNKRNQQSGHGNSSNSNNSFNRNYNNNYNNRNQGQNRNNNNNQRQTANNTRYAVPEGEHNEPISQNVRLGNARRC
jgi:hypothetical protein